MAHKHGSEPAATTGQSVFDHIRDLVAEEQRLYQHQSPTEADRTRLQRISIELDRYWDLLRQRRALEEHGSDPGKARMRPAQIVERYEG